VSVTDAKGNVRRTEYDAEGNVTARVDALGRRASYTYDALNRLVETTDPSGASTTQGFCADVSGQACGVVDPLGNLTQVSFDALGRPLATLDPNGHSTQQEYDLAGRRVSSTDASGAKTGYGYDAAGRLASVTDPLGGITAYGYDARGNRTSVTDANGNTTLFTYDGANRLQTETNPIGNVTRYEYDGAGNRKAKVDGNGNRTEYDYDENRRLVKVRFQDGTSYDFGYDRRGNRTLEKSASHERQLAYDELGRLNQVKDQTLGRTITYGYDANGNRASMQVDTGEEIGYRWDAAGRLAEVTDPDGDVTSFSYDAAGRRSRVSYGNQTYASYGYDAAGQVLSIVYANQKGQVLTAFGYGYDENGNRQFKSFADGTKEDYGYDKLNRLTSVKYPGASARQVSYGYDGVGNRVSLVDTSRGTVTRWAVSATASSQASTSPYGGGASGTVGPPDTGFWMPVRTGSQPEWVEVTFAQAEPARGVRVHETYRAPCVMRVDLTDDAGQVHQVFDGGDATPNNGWLALTFPVTTYKVKKVRVWTASQYQQGMGSEQIDAVGLDAQPVDTYQYNGFNQLLAVNGSDGSTTAFTYDGNGNQVTKVDASGTTTYVYNQANRLVGIALPSGVSDSFAYDANGLRVNKTDSTGPSSYLLDGMSVIGQYGPDGKRQVWYTQSLAKVDEVLSVVKDQATGWQGKLWYESDALGSVYALAGGSQPVQMPGVYDPVTGKMGWGPVDFNGRLAVQAGYDVFGAQVAVAGTMGQPFGFAGREHEGDSGLVYSRARYLQPGVGDWTQSDPAGQIGGPNYYAYVRARPVVATDPAGLMSTMDTYAIAQPYAFLMLMEDLGIIRTAALVVSAAAVAYPLAQVMSNTRESDNTGVRTDVTVCPTRRPSSEERTYYRGLSLDDVRELWLFGKIYSKFVRYGFGGFVEALQYFVMGAARHPGGSDVINYDEKMDGKPPIPSPFVSVSSSPQTARQFADDGPSPGHVVVSFTTTRKGIGPTPGFGEGEYLFFLLLGEPGETLEVMP